MPRLTDSTYLAFPFRINPDGGGPLTAGRELHVRNQIEQTLFTSPGERVFRHEFGAGVRRLVFEPFSDSLAELTRNRLAAALTDVLLGEVDPKTLTIDVSRGDAAYDADGRLELTVSYRLATINREETHTFTEGVHG
jgi:phage baseplate assembly protein W